MSPDVRAELCASLASKMRGEGGILEANSAKTCGQEPDDNAGNETDGDTPTSGCLMMTDGFPHSFGSQEVGQTCSWCMLMSTSW